MMDYLPQLGKMIYALSAVLVVIAVLSFVCRKNINSLVKGKSDFTLLSNFSLGRKERVVLLRVKNKEVLLGVTANNITTLLEIEKDNA